MTNIVSFPKKPDSADPMDSETMLTLSINGKGEGEIWIADYIETVEQYNWLIAKIVDVSGDLIAAKNRVIDSDKAK